jgi:FKBP-type peptidyl-prolyl cis-trans isomerase
MKYLYILFSLFCLVNCTSQKKSAGAAAANDYTTTPSGLKYKILQKGSGAQAKAGQEVLIRETTTYLDGTVLYTNETTGSPVKVLIGGNQATTAVDEGLRGMQTGEIRLLIATPDLVRRKSYPQNVSPDSSLAIKIILHKIL